MRLPDFIDFYLIYLGICFQTWSLRLVKYFSMLTIIYVLFLVGGFFFTKKMIFLTELLALDKFIDWEAKFTVFLLIFWFVFIPVITLAASHLPNKKVRNDTMN